MYLFPDLHILLFEKKKKYQKMPFFSIPLNRETINVKKIK